MGQTQDYKLPYPEFQDFAKVPSDIKALAEATETAIKGSEWIDLPLAEGVVSYSDALKPQYRVIGRIVYLSGVITNILAANTALANMPVELRPKKQQYFIFGSATVSGIGATNYNAQISTSGIILANSHSTNTYNTNYFARLLGYYFLD